MDHSLPVFSVHGISQARILEWVAVFYSKSSSWTRDWTCISYIGRQILYHWATWEAQDSLLGTWFRFSSVTQLCLILCDPMNHSTPGLPVHHQLLESTQTHVHWVSDAIQPSHPLSSPSPPALNLSPHQGLFKWVSSSHGQSIGVSASTSVLPVNIQDWSPLGWTAWISLQSKGLSTVFSNTTVRKHQFFGAQLSSPSNSHIHTWLSEKTLPWVDGPFLAK